MHELNCSIRCGWACDPASGMTSTGPLAMRLMMRAPLQRSSSTRLRGVLAVEPVGPAVALVATADRSEQPAALPRLPPPLRGRRARRQRLCLLGRCHRPLRRALPVSKLDQHLGRGLGSCDQHPKRGRGPRSPLAAGWHVGRPRRRRKLLSSPTLRRPAWRTTRLYDDHPGQTSRWRVSFGA